MNLKIITKATEPTSVGFIGKTGVLRIKERDTLRLGISKSQRWMLGLDMDESSSRKHIYLLKAQNNSSYFTRKMTVSKGGIFLDINIILSEINLKPPIKCPIETFNENEHEGLRIKIA